MPPSRRRLKPVEPAPLPVLHAIKSWPQFYAELLAGRKLFEVRKNDRDYRPRDYLLLREYDPAEYTFTGRSSWWQIVYLTKDHPGIRRGYIVMSIVPVDEVHVPLRLRDQVTVRKRKRS